MEAEKSKRRREICQDSKFRIAVENGDIMANTESEKRQLRAQIERAKSTIMGLEETLDRNPNDRSAKEELRRQKQQLQGLRDELNS